MSVNPLRTMLLSKDDASVHQFVESVCLNMGKQEYEKSVISTVNSLLTSSKTRLMGLELLQALIMYCSYDSLSENALNWSSYCIVHHPEDSGREVKLNTLEKILDKTNDIETFTKKFLTEYLNATLKSCLVSQNKAEKIAGLKCLTQCMKRYPSWFGNHKQKIESYLIKCLESHCQVVTETAALAFVCLLETGPAGVNSINYINNFSSHFKKLCATIQFLYNSFFQDFPEINNSVNIDGDVFNELTVGFTVENALEVTSNRIINCLIFLKTLITKKFSVEKRIVLKYVFDIINRGLSAHVCVSEVVISNMNVRCMFLKKIQVYLLRIFGATIQGYQSSLLPFAALIENILLNSLQRTSKCDCFVFDKSYKTLIYKTLIHWLAISKVISDSHFQQKLVPMVLEDISPVKKTTSLNVDKSGKKKLKLNISSSDRKALISDIVVEKNCLHALEVLKILLASSFSVDPTILKDLVLSVTKLLDDIQVGKPVAPYNKIACQTKLYEVFISFFNLENFKILLPSMHSLINVINRGLKSRNQKISQVSSEGLELLQKISHPICPTLDITDLKSIVSHDRFSYDSLEKRDEVLQVSVSENQHEKEIKIISNIVINKSYDDEEKNDHLIDNIEDEEMEENESTESNIQAVCEEMLATTVGACAESIVDVDSISEDFEIKETIPETVEEKSEVQVISDSDVDNGVENMFSSFIDVVQE